LRIDAIPPDVYFVPWMRPNPSLEELKAMPGMDGPPWDIDSAMADALKLNMTFRIVCQHGTINETRVVPSTVYLAYDMNYLYVGGKFNGMGRNPASNSSDNPGTILANYFQILFDVKNDGVLTNPESGSTFAVTIDENANWRTRMTWWVEDMVWGYYPAARRVSWAPATDVGMNVRTWGLADVQYNNSTGTLAFIFSRYLWMPGYYMDNALQMRAGERWVIRFVLELGYNTWFATYSDFVDGWPRNTYPNLLTDKDSSWWPKLVIDLTNPPSEFT
jgi:hypothetical protein